MEMLFSCQIRKRVRFSQTQDLAVVSVDDKLTIPFKPVKTQTCSLDDIQGETLVEAFPIANPQSFASNWLRIDCWRKQWVSEFMVTSNRGQQCR